MLRSSSTRAIVGIKTCSVRATPHHLKPGKLGRSVSIPRQSHDSSKALPSIRELWQWRKALAAAQKYRESQRALPNGSGPERVNARHPTVNEPDAAHLGFRPPGRRQEAPPGKPQRSPGDPDAGLGRPLLLAGQCGDRRGWGAAPPDL